MATRYKANDATQPGRVRYVFAGTETEAEREDTKVCPRCGQLLFEDMPICYGCLYDFEKDRPRQTASGALRQVPSPTSRPSDPLASIELDEIDEEEPLVPPRHRKATQGKVGNDDTIDLGSPMSEAVSSPDPAAFFLDVSTDGMSVRVPLAREGIGVGRDAANEIVLKARSVSRSHVRVVPDADGVVVQDCGATNPAFVDGTPLQGSRRVKEGSEIEIGDVIMRVGMGTVPE